MTHYALLLGAAVAVQQFLLCAVRGSCSSRKPSVTGQASANLRRNSYDLLTINIPRYIFPPATSNTNTKGSVGLGRAYSLALGAGPMAFMNLRTCPLNASGCCSFALPGALMRTDETEQQIVVGCRQAKPSQITPAANSVQFIVHLHVSSALNQHLFRVRQLCCHHVCSSEGHPGGNGGSAAEEAVVNNWR